MEIKYTCSNCENEISNESIFCPYCGGYVNHEYAGMKCNVEIIAPHKAVSNHYLKVYPVNLEERKIAIKIIETITKLNIKQNTEDYTTLVYKDIDIVRIRCTNTNKYLKLNLSSNDRKIYKDNLLFKEQQNKQQVFWSSIYDEKNFNEYIQLISNKIEEIDK